MDFLSGACQAANVAASLSGASPGMRGAKPRRFVSGEVSGSSGSRGARDIWAPVQETIPFWAFWLRQVACLGTGDCELGDLEFGLFGFSALLAASLGLEWRVHGLHFKGLCRPS